MNLDTKASKFSGRLFTRLYFTLVVSIIVIGSSIEYFLNRSDESSHLNYVKDLHQTSFVLWVELLLNSPTDQWQVILSQLKHDKNLSTGIFTLNDFAGDEVTLEQLSNGELLALFDSQDALSLYQRIGLTLSLIHI